MQSLPDAILSVRFRRVRAPSSAARMWSCAWAALALVSTGATSPSSAGAAGQDSVSAAGICETDAFFFHHFDAYAEMKNLSLMREGKVLMDPHGVTDIEGFFWEGHPNVSTSWMMDIEELLYLLPFIGSDLVEDRAFAVGWFRRWALAHTWPATPHPAAWDGMTAGIRSAVLVYFLQRECERPSGGISAELTETLGVHRRMLVEGKFDSNSNHGVWQAIGLIEVGRALSDDDALALGLSRLEEQAIRHVSSSGFHMEHAAKYHFVFLKWLDHAVVYLEGLLDVGDGRLTRLQAVRDRMMAAGYYLQDHANLVLPIGDSFRLPVHAAYRIDAGLEGRFTRFDTVAGYACYKEPSAPGTGRHIVFNIQPPEREFPYHFHDDAGAVILSYRGELILGDQGAYDYGRSKNRHFVVSAGAHNIVGPAAEVFSTTRLKTRSGHVINPRHVDGDSFIFAAGREYDTGSLSRAVTVPFDGVLLVVDDEIDGSDMVMIWNIGPDVMTALPRVVNASDGWWDASWSLHARSGRVFELSLATAEVSAVRDVQLLRGRDQPMVGWYSAAYGQIVPSLAVVATIDAVEPVRMRTMLRLLEDVE